MLHTVVLILIVIGIIAANLPWLSERLFLFFDPPGGNKTIAMRLLEWLLLLMLYVLGALGTEYKMLGVLHGARVPVCGFRTAWLYLPSRPETASG